MGTNGLNLSTIFLAKVRNGERIPLWTDLCCESEPLQVRFPGLFAIKELKYCRVGNIIEHLVSDNIDALNWRRHPRGGPKEEEIINLWRELQMVNLCDQTNRLQWTLSEARTFSVKSETR